jgi:hypothetical protein
VRAVGATVFGGGSDRAKIDTVSRRAASPGKTGGGADALSTARSSGARLNSCSVGLSGASAAGGVIRVVRLRATDGGCIESGTGGAVAIWRSDALISGDGAKLAACIATGAAVAPGIVAVATGAAVASGIVAVTTGTVAPGIVAVTAGAALAEARRSGVRARDGPTGLDVCVSAAALAEARRSGIRARDGPTGLDVCVSAAARASSGSGRGTANSTGSPGLSGSAMRCR